MAAKTNLIKETNLERLRETMRSRSSFTKPQLAEATGLSVVTINALLKTLEAQGEVEALGMEASEGGRPAQVYAYNLAFKMALAVYLMEEDGVDTAHFLVLNLLGDVVASQNVPLPSIELTSFDPSIQRFVEAYPSICAICFGIPGGEVDGKMIVSDYPKLRNKSLSAHLKDRFGVAVLIENDVNVAVLGFTKRLDIAPNDSVCAIYFPEKYPPGAGFYLDSGVYKGFKGLAGEIKDLPIGVDWESPLSEDAFSEAVIKLVQTFAYMLNPKHLVLYGRRLDEDLPNKQNGFFTGPLAKAIQPVCHVEKAFHPDFELGLKMTALKLIGVAHLGNVLVAPNLETV